jgi:hypothetical protein
MNPMSAISARRYQPTFAWWAILCLVGLDYFSSLAYLPSIAVAQMQDLAPIAAIGVVLVTLFAALPVYWYVVGRSPHGKGGIGLLEERAHGWRGKVLILILLGFVATDFVLTRTLSVSDASVHILGNPEYHDHAADIATNREAIRGSLPEALRGGFFDFWNEQLILTVLLSILAFGLYFFLVRSINRGFLGVAVGIVVLYLLLNAIVIGSGLSYLVQHSDLVERWRRALPDELAHFDTQTRTSVGWLVVLALHAFPPMAIGLSGFELSMASAPLVRGSPGDTESHPQGRIFKTRFLMAMAAVIMCVLVLSSVFVVTLLVPTGEIIQGDVVQHRALAYLAHGSKLNVPITSPDQELSPLFGGPFGTLYDLSTVLILCLAGATATISMKQLVPDFLSRFGMQMVWAHKIDVITHLFNGVILLVTILFKASVTAQLWAYAASVLALLFGASLAATLDVRHRLHGLFRGVVEIPFFLITALFVVMGGLIVSQHPSGVGIALVFVAVVLFTAIVSRWRRSTELRFEGFEFSDEPAKQRWEEICKLDFQVLVPHDPSHGTLKEKEEVIRRRHRLAADVPIIFIEAKVGDPSDFFQKPLMKIERENDSEVIRVERCTSIAHVIASIALAFREVGQPPEVHFSWSEESPMAANLNFLLLGHGNIPWMVHALLRNQEPDVQRRPRVIVG